MKGLDHGRAPLPGRAVAGRRQQRKGVVEVHQVGPVLGHQRTESAARSHVPHRGGGDAQAAHPEGEAVIDRVPEHEVTAPFEQVRFGEEDLVLSAGLEVIIVSG